MLSAISFLAMLGSVAVVIYWYVLNAELNQGGNAGILGISDEVVEDETETQEFRQRWKRDEQPEISEMKTPEAPGDQNRYKHHDPENTAYSARPATKYHSASRKHRQRPEKSYRRIDDK